MAVTCQKMEKSRSHIVASAQLNVFFCIYINAIYILIFIMKSQNRAKLACLYKLWAPKLYFAKKIKTPLGGPYFSIKLVPGSPYYSNNMDRGVQICHHLININAH